MKDAPAYVPPPTWTGFYIGAHVGGVWAEDKATDGGLWQSYQDQAYSNVTRSFTTNADGVFGGGTAGYNFQTGSFVFGVEADFGAVGLTGSWNDGALTGFTPTTKGYIWGKSNDSFYADVTGRLGYAVGPALFYVKGGWAFLDNPISIGGHWNSDWSKSVNGLDGWVIGGGVEYLFAPSWSVKAEYLYFDFGNTNVGWTDPKDIPNNN